MKISKLRKFAGVFFALALGTSTLFAQGWRNNNRAFAQNNQKVTCVNYLSDLTENQIETISALEAKHQEQMDALRDKRRATTNWEEKDLIREQMLESIVAHRNEVRNQLSSEQQKEYDLLQLRGNNHRNQTAVNQRGNGNVQSYGKGNRQNFARGNCSGCGRGNAVSFRNCTRLN